MILLDLDRTLFDTSAYLDALIDEVLPTMCDDGPVYIRQLFEAQRPGTGTLLYELNYNTIFDALGVTADQFMKAAAAMLKPNRFVYNDAIMLLEWIEKHHLTAETQILSFGSRDMQTFKVKISPCLQVFNMLTTQTYKRDYIAENLNDGESGYLIDDKPGQNLPKGWTEIYLNRDSGERPIRTAEDMWQISTLVDAHVIFQKP